MFSAAVKFENRPFVMFNVDCLRVLIPHYHMVFQILSLSSQRCGGRVVSWLVKNEYSQVQVLCPYTWVHFSNKYDQVITMYLAQKKGAHYLNPATTSTFTEQAI